MGLLQDDQKRIRGLFRQLQVLRQRAPVLMPGIAMELFLELELHAFAELDQVLPELFEGADVSVRGDLERAREFYSQILMDVEPLKSADSGDGLRSEQWNASLAEFRKTVDFVFELELRTVFPWVGRLSRERADEIFVRIMDLRRAILATPGREAVKRKAG